VALFYFRERSNNLPVLFSCPGSGSSGIMMCILCIFPTFFCFLFFTFVPRFRQPRFRSLRPHLKNLCGDLPLRASHIHTIVQSRASLRARPGPIPHCLRPTCIVGSEVIRQPEGSTHRYTAWANSLTQVLGFMGTKKSSKRRGGGTPDHPPYPKLGGGRGGVRPPPPCTQIL